MSSWREVVAFSQPLTANADDTILTYRPMTNVPVIVFDPATGMRKVVPMRWGFPDRKNPNRPNPIHARFESIDEKPTFRDAFLNAQRGIVAMRTFNEGKDLPNGKTEQWTIDPLDGAARGFAFLWRRFDIGLPLPLLACVMITVPASKLIEPVTDRMPAILAGEDWPTWLGENAATPAEAKAVLKTVEGVHWQMMREPKRPK